jgi:aspartyl-tRNA(Asn)/glutamyl-tRNA(Gln) amidotransferase subunit A
MPLRRVAELRLGLARAPYWQRADSETERAMTAAVGTLSRIARMVRDVQLPTLSTRPESSLPATYETVIIAEAFAFHREMLARSPERYHKGTRASIESGRSVTAAEYIDARREMERLRATAAAQLFRDADLLITPTAPGTVFKLGSRPSLVYLSNTAPWNLYGLPTISIPCGFDRSGLPIGLQITGGPDRDSDVLSLAAAYQDETDFHRRRPPVSG